MQKQNQALIKMKSEKQYRQAIGGTLLNLRIAMTEDGIRATQEDVAFQAGISTRYYGSIERGKVTPSVYTLAKIANALQMPLYELCKHIENY